MKELTIYGPYEMQNYFHYIHNKSSPNERKIFKYLREAILPLPFISLVLFSKLFVQWNIIGTQ